jgi:transposase-like protein
LASGPRHWKTPVITWLVDETYVKILGKWHYLYRGVDLDGHVLDLWLSARGLKSPDCAKRLLPALDAFQLIEHGFVAATCSGLAHAGGRGSVRACRVAGIVNQGSRL